MSESLASPQIFGTWKDTMGISSEHSTMMLDAEDLNKYWRRNSLSSDFWARYNALLISEFPEEGFLDRVAMEDILAYLHNELFENCAKFSSRDKIDIIYQVWYDEDAGFIFQFRNHIEPEKQSDFIAIIEELLSGDLEELYLTKMEENFELDSAGSGLGYLTLMKDYGVRFGFCFTQVNERDIAVDVQAHIDSKEIL